MNPNTKEKIKALVLDCVRRTVKRVKANKDSKPFHEAILSEQLLKFSSFERSFSTSFGQKAIEEMSRLVALDANSGAERQKETRGAIRRAQNIAINDTLQ